MSALCTYDTSDLCHVYPPPSATWYTLSSLARDRESWSWSWSHPHLLRLETGHPRSLRKKNKLISPVPTPTYNRYLSRDRAGQSSPGPSPRLKKSAGLPQFGYVAYRPGSAGPMLPPFHQMRPSQSRCHAFFFIPERVSK